MYYTHILSDLSLTNTAVSTVTATIEAINLGNTLAVPYSKQDEMQQLLWCSASGQELKAAFIDYFLKYSDYASWSDLASKLYYFEHHKALAEAKEFISGSPGKMIMPLTMTCLYLCSLTYLEPTLNLCNLTALLENVNWELIGPRIDIPHSKCTEIKRQCSSDSQCKQECWKLYLEDHPSPRWKQVAQALYRFNYLDELEIVQNNYLRGMQLIPLVLSISPFS